MKSDASTKMLCTLASLAATVEAIFVSKIFFMAKCALEMIRKICEPKKENFTHTQIHIQEASERKMSKTAQLNHEMATKNIFVATEKEGHEKKGSLPRQTQLNPAKSFLIITK